MNTNSMNTLEKPVSWGEKRYYSLDYYLKQTFGEKVYRLSLNGGMTCPNRDGTLDSRGCIFCSAGGSGDFAAAPALSVTAQIAEAKKRVTAKTDCRKFIAYFQAYTNTYAPVAFLKNLFTEAIKQPEIVALSIATRCDCLSPEILDLLEELNKIKPVWVELGLQTIHSDTLKFIRSGFTLQQYEAAVYALHARQIDVITHLILGLPGETKNMMRSSVSYVAAMPVSGIKLQLLHILKGTDLGTIYKKEPFPLFSLEEYCDFITECISLLPPEMVIHRLTGDGPRQLLLAPSWSTDKKRVLNTIQKRLKEKNLWQGKYFSEV
ncbi:MAG: TIGR01212 family radical SAM protein [Clostridiales bacterium]|nr:TIGR01212 family radical SAM protein [Clostridiales bacterium]